MNDQNTTQNPITEENSIPPSPPADASSGEARQEPTADVPIPATVSTPAEVPSGATEASGAGFGAKIDNIPPSNSAPLGGFGEQTPVVEQAHYGAGTEETQAQNEPSPEPISESVEAPEPSAESESIQTDRETAQMGRNEPLPAEGEAKGESSRAQTQAPRNPVREVLAKAQLAIQNKKRKKLDSIMTLFANPSSRAKHTTGQVSITNNEVEKFLHVSDATATRYLSQLETENKIKQSGKTGRSVSYSKI